MFLNLLIDNSFLIVLAVGMTFVILTGGIDLSVGAVVALQRHDRGVAAARTGWSPAVVIPVCSCSRRCSACSSGCMIHVFEVQPFIATLAAMFLARGLCYVISQSSIPINDPTFVQLAQSPASPLGGNLSITPSGVIAVVVVAIAFVVLHATRFGRTVYAIGGSEQSALLMGLPVARTKVLVYVISGFCCGLGRPAVRLLLAVGLPAHGVGMELDAIAAVVIGGTLLTGGCGFVLGSVLGVLVLGVIQTHHHVRGHAVARGGRRSSSARCCWSSSSCRRS